ncbi:hypothetical protein ACFL3G_00060 [Planctomycetota bacterium]
MGLETRKKTSKDINDRKDKMKKRGDNMEKVVKEKLEIIKVANSLELTTTKDGIEKMKAEFKQAARKTKDEFKKQNSDLQKKVDKCKVSNGKLRQKTDAAVRNLRKITHVEGQIHQAKKAKSDLTKGARIAESDRKFTTNEKKRQEKFKKDGENRRKTQQNKLNGMKLPCTW